MHSKLTIQLAFLLIAGSARTQTSWHINKLNIADGLSEGYVYAIHQDKKGFIWIGTHGGLNRYDGYGFKIFQYEPFNSSSLGDNGVFFLKEDPASGKFWTGGSSSLNEFDPETFSNIRYSYNNVQIEYSDGIFVNDDEMLLAWRVNGNIPRGPDGTFDGGGSHITYTAPESVPEERTVQVSAKIRFTSAMYNNGRVVIQPTEVIFFIQMALILKIM